MLDARKKINLNPLESPFLMLTISDPKNTHTVEVSAPDGILLNGEPFAWDIQSLGENRYHILHQNRSYTAEVVEINRADKTLTLTINGHTYSLQVKDQFDFLLEKMGMGQTAQTRTANLKAPMPGLIRSLTVQPGDAVKKGDSLLVLEAMKMENVLKAPADATITAIRIAPGDTVEKGQTLIEF